MWSTLLLVYCVNLLVYRTVDATQCYECIDMPHPSDCEYATTCTSSEKCYVEQFISSGGLVLYKSGCMAKTRCSVAGKRDIGDREKRADITVCQECCDGDFCNGDGCGQQAVLFPQRGLRCYNCKDLLNLSDCRDLTTCQDPSEVCMVHDFVGPDNQPRYETKCERSLVCKALSNLHGKRSTAYNCVSCCDKDFCNVNCNGTSTGSSSSAVTGSVHMGGATSSATITNPTTVPPTTRRATTQALPPTTTASTLNPQDFCQQDSYLFFGFIPLCFKIHKELKSRAEAQTICQREQGQLAIIDSAMKWDFITKVYSQQRYGSAPEFYIDGAYDSSHNSFSCKGNSQCDFTQWGTGQPQNPASKPCVYLNGTDAMKWYNSACSERKMFICTKRI